MNEQFPLIGPVMKAARKFRKYNQADVAQAIGCSQSALSKMEHNLLIPSAPQWFLFARFTKIPPETLETGFIDRHSRVKMNNDEISLGYKLPRRFRLQRAQKVRELYPFFTYMKKHFPEETFHQWLTSTGLDEEFFLDFDNLVNFQLILDTISFLLKNQSWNEAQIQQLVQEGQDHLFWDRFEVIWQKLASVEEVLEAFVECQTFFQGDFKLSFEEGKPGKLSYLPLAHLSQVVKEANPESLQFLKIYRQQTLKQLIERTLKQSIEIEVLESASPTLGAAFQIRH
jgi:transcriptional regulator with XRE-family HTH domain